MITFVYAHNEGSDRMPLWNYLSQTSFDMPWSIMGDFNCILGLNEVKGGREYWTPNMQRFKYCVTAANITTLRTLVDTLTWYNKNPSAPIFKKLDRVLVNSKWMHTFPEAQAQVLNRGIMDHCPLIVHAYGVTTHKEIFLIF